MADPVSKTTFTRHERAALIDAVSRNGWGLFLRTTTARLGQLGLFAKEQHPAYGMQWRLTPAGQLAAAEARNAK